MEVSEIVMIVQMINSLVSLYVNNVDKVQMTQEEKDKLLAEVKKAKELLPEWV